MSWSWKTSTAYSFIPSWIAVASSGDSGFRMSIPSTSAAKHGPIWRIFTVMIWILLSRVPGIVAPPRPDVVLATSQPSNAREERGRADGEGDQRQAAGRERGADPEERG